MDSPITLTAQDIKNMAEKETKQDQKIERLELEVAEIKGNVSSHERVLNNIDTRFELFEEKIMSKSDKRDAALLEEVRGIRLDSEVRENENLKKWVWWILGIIASIISALFIFLLSL